LNFNPTHLGVFTDSLIITCGDFSLPIRVALIAMCSSEELFTVTLNPGIGTVVENTLSQSTNGELLILPEVLPSEQCFNDGWRFLGWSETMLSSETTDCPEYVTAGNYFPLNNTTLYAVFRRMWLAEGESYYKVLDDDFVEGNFVVAARDSSNGGSIRVMPNYTLGTAEVQYPGTIQITDFVQYMNGLPYIFKGDGEEFQWNIQKSGDKYGFFNGEAYLGYRGSGTSSTMYPDMTTWLKSQYNISEATGIGAALHEYKVSVDSTGINRGILYQQMQLGSDASQEFRAGYSFTNITPVTGNLYHYIMLLPLLDGDFYYDYAPQCGDIMPQVDFDPVCGSYFDEVDVSLSVDIPDTVVYTIYYTLDGTNPMIEGIPNATPNPSALIYDGTPIHLSISTTITAVAISISNTYTTNMSSVATCVYEIVTPSLQHTMDDIPLTRNSDLPDKVIFFTGNLKTPATISSSNPDFEIRFGKTSINAGINLRDTIVVHYSGQGVDSTTISYTYDSYTEEFKLYSVLPLTGYTWYSDYNSPQYSYLAYHILLSKYGINHGSTISTNAHQVPFNTSNMLTADAWQIDEGDKYWELGNIVTTDYKNIYFEMRQSGSATGPKNWTVEYKIGSGEWNTFAGNTYSVVESNYNKEGPFYLPAECNNQPSISLRLKVVDNFRITVTASDETIGPVGTSKLKLIEVYGVPNTCNLSFVLDFEGISCSGNIDVIVSGDSPFADNKFDIRFDDEGENLQISPYTHTPLDAGLHTISVSNAAGCMTKKHVRVIK
jgi:hypothetical protein